MNIKIMNARPEDAKGIQEVYYKTWLDTYPNEEYNITRDDIEDSYKDSFSEERLKKLSERISSHPANIQYIVAKDGSNIVGVCQPIIFPDKNKLQTIYILPDYQGKGIGTKLWNEANKLFDPDKDTYVEVVVYNLKTISFYEKLGFKDTGRRFSEDRFKMKNGSILPEMEMCKKALP